MARDLKVLRWAQLFQPLIPVGVQLSGTAIALRSPNFGDGNRYGNGGGNGRGGGIDSPPWPYSGGYGFGTGGYSDGDGDCGP